MVLMNTFQTHSGTIDIDNIKVLFNYQQFPLWKLRGCRKLYTKDRKSCTLDTISAFDIETSKINVDGEQHSFMYIWQWKLLDYVVVGRYWYEFQDFLQQVQDVLRETRLIVFVHNLSYEFQFLKGVIDFKELNNKNKRKVFAVKNRKVLRCEVSDSIEFRCSYLQSNMSLAKLCDTYNTQHKKLDGQVFDYNKFRTATTELSQYEIMYSVIDVISLCEAIEVRMRNSKDTLLTIPLTSTGYVRRDVKKLTSKKWKEDNSADFDTFKLLTEAYRGGDTHANRYYASCQLENVMSVDRSSSYPAEMVNKDFPLGKWKNIEADKKTLKELINQHIAFVARIKLSDVALKDEFNGMPYFSKSKCQIKKEIIKVTEKLQKTKHLAKFDQKLL